MDSTFRPGPALRAFQSWQLPRKLGLGEVIWSESLARLGITWVEFGSLRWKLNLANDTHRWLMYGEYEEPGVRRLLERVLDSQSVIIDSGANIGQMVVMYLRSGSPAMVHAFEPTPEARAWLEECVVGNQLRNVSVSALALADVPRAAHFMLHEFGFKEGAKNHLSESGRGLPIDVTTLDVYAATHQIDRIRFWKLDIEGQELAALLGATALLERAAIDYLYIETASAGQEIEKLLQKFAYVAVTLALDRVLSPAEVRTRFTNVFVSQPVVRGECHLALKTA